LALVAAALAVPVASLADDEDPVITVPADMTVEAQNFSGATVTYTASAVDRNNRSIPVTCVPGSGTIFGFGQTTVTCTARDAQGRSSTKRFQVTVVDTKPPAISVPAPIRVTTTTKAGKAVAYTASATDVVDGPVTPTCAPPSQSLFAVGTTTVTCSAADRRGNATNASFTVTVVHVVKRSTKSSALLSPKAGARITRPPLLTWRRKPNARFYNVQVFHKGHKVLSTWPTRPRLQLHAHWTFEGRSYRLRSGIYTWLVWPAFGSPTRPRYGKMLGISSFVYARR
jgi:hypothetical protein